MKGITKHCPNCESEHLSFIETSSWDSEAQKYVHDYFNVKCEDCGIVSNTKDIIEVGLPLNLYYVKPKTDLTGYDVFKSFVVATYSEELASKYHPRGKGPETKWWDINSKHYNDWDCSWVHPDHVHVTLIGKADPSIEVGVLISDFYNG